MGLYTDLTVSDRVRLSEWRMEKSWYVVILNLILYGLGVRVGDSLTVQIIRGR